MAADAAGQIRRSPMEMVCDILAVVSVGPTKPTHILYKANMSWKVLSSYLDFLTGSGMLDKEEQEGGKRSTYRLTTKGKQILRLYEGLKSSLNSTRSVRRRPLAGVGTFYGVNDNKNHDERYRKACATWMRSRGYSG